MRPQIDPEFRALIPPLTPDERQQLEDNIKLDGCRDPLVVWNGVLLDGHNRLEICEAHQIPYQTVEHSCDSREEAMVWVIRNQFGRRNLPLYVRIELALALEPMLTGASETNRLRNLKYVGDLIDATNSNYRSPRLSERRGRIAQLLGRVAGGSEETFYRVKAIQNRAPAEMHEQLRRGDISINHAYLAIVQQKLHVPRAKRRSIPLPERRKEARDLVDRLTTLLTELRRQRKANHDDLKTRRWVPENIVTRRQTEQLNWIETELDTLVHALRVATPIASPSRAQTARHRASPGDSNGHSESSR